MMDLRTRYTCWRISRDLEKPVDDCQGGDRRCLGLARGDICPTGNTVDF